MTSCARVASWHLASRQQRRMLWVTVLITMATMQVLPAAAAGRTLHQWFVISPRPFSSPVTAPATSSQDLPSPAPSPAPSGSALAASPAPALQPLPVTPPQPSLHVPQDTSDIGPSTPQPSPSPVADPGAGSAHSSPVSSAPSPDAEPHGSPQQSPQLSPSPSRSASPLPSPSLTPSPSPSASPPRSPSPASSPAKPSPAPSPNQSPKLSPSPNPSPSPKPSPSPSPRLSPTPIASPNPAPNRSPSPVQGPLGPNTGASNTASASASTPALDVWIIAGQSNAVGENYLDGTSMPQPCASPVRGRLLMYPLSTSNWTDAAPSVGDISNGRFVHSSIGPDMGFGRALLSSGVSNLVGLVPTAMASTGLASHWMPPASFLYKRMISGARAAVAAANAAGQAAQLQGLIWVQGEEDAKVQASADAYASNFKTFLSSLRSDLQDLHPRLPVLMGAMSVTNRDIIFPYIRTVRQAQLALVSDPATPGIIPVDLEGLQFYAQDIPCALSPCQSAGSQWVHLTKRGQCALGANLAQAWQASGLQQ